MDLLTTINPKLFNDTKLLTECMQVAFCTFNFFLVFYYASHYVLKNVIQVKLYIDMKPLDQADFLSRITAQVHAVIATYLGYQCIFNLCDHPSKDMFNDWECYVQEDPYALKVLMFSASFILFDMLIIFKEI